MVKFIIISKRKNMRYGKCENHSLNYCYSVISACDNVIIITCFHYLKIFFVLMTEKWKKDTQAEINQVFNIKKNIRNDIRYHDTKYCNDPKHLNSKCRSKQCRP